MRLTNGRESNIVRSPACGLQMVGIRISFSSPVRAMGLLTLGVISMKEWQFCFLKDEYYAKFPDHGLLMNKEEVNGVLHYRPCFFAFTDNEREEIFWLVPVSSQKVMEIKSMLLKELDCEEEN